MAQEIASPDSNTDTTDSDTTVTENLSTWKYTNNILLYVSASAQIAISLLSRH